MLGTEAAVVQIPDGSYRVAVAELKRLVAFLKECGADPQVSERSFLF